MTELTRRTPGESATRAGLPPAPWQVELPSLDLLERVVAGLRDANYGPTGSGPRCWGTAPSSTEARIPLGLRMFHLRVIRAPRGWAA